MIETYFGAERSGGLLFVIAGTLAIGSSIWGWQHGPFWRGAAWPLAAVALIQIGVGITYLLRSPADLQRVQHIVTREQARIAGEEVPRMQAVLKSYATSLRIEVAILAVGLALLMLATRGGSWQGTGFGLAVQAGLVLLLDGLAERRAQTYLEWLRAL
ncbi:TPA: hypothetical protein ACPHWC_001851 [Pseudomonas aeruginosa]|uniref:hypothetical protein n=1 Tax=Pseudomonas aeruginosa TaxID=287 RepID=UPI00053DFF1F|nr:hypothetical protein [Pseudomonas aeruginosa]EIU5457910.1 hypothetical protein [Pseudomonas aeruginosa]EIU5538914.1 hypothetical protein [Pseudomonas aeruginosa]EKY0072522.1 hypothetical protein [Pseudomonas aeruginosa]EKY0497979.1 hypothetical protein [Pseudomonas aeruginosa]EKY1844874.1 hypothetical protein [Pseudomonas aeruginosa]